jgi:hypothetical protein
VLREVAGATRRTDGGRLQSEEGRGSVKMQGSNQQVFALYHISDVFLYSQNSVSEKLKIFIFIKMLAVSILCNKNFHEVD